MAFRSYNARASFSHLWKCIWRSRDRMHVLFRSYGVEYMAFWSYHAFVYLTGVSLTISDSPPRLRKRFIKNGFSPVRVPAVIRRLMSHAECLEELGTVSAYNEALQRAFEDIIIDHPDIELPLNPKDYKGKGPEPCRDNEWELKNEQLTNKVSELQKELDGEIASWKGLQDDISSAPRSCLDEDGKLKKGSGNNRPPKTGKTLSEQLAECKQELRKHNDGQNGCDAKMQKVTDQLKQCQADNAKNCEKSKTDAEQLCQDQLDAQKKDLDAKHKKDLDDAQISTHCTLDGVRMNPGDRVIFELCQKRVGELKGELDLKDRYCNERSGESSGGKGKGKGKGRAPKMAKRQIDDEEVTEETDEELSDQAEAGPNEEAPNEEAADAEDPAEEVPSPDDDQAAGNSSLASPGDMLQILAYDPPAQCNEFVDKCEQRVAELMDKQCAPGQGAEQQKQCQAALDKKLEEQEKFWRGEVDIWKAQSKTSDDRAVSIGEKCAAASKQKLEKIHAECKKHCPPKKPHGFCFRKWGTPRPCNQQKNPKWCKACEWV